VKRGGFSSGRSAVALVLAVAGLAATVPRVPEAARGEGSAGAVLARLPVGARSLGLGGAHVALPQSLESMSVNPAALSALDSLNVEATYHQGAEGVAYNGLLLAVPAASWLTLGGSIETLSAGLIEAYDYAGNLHKSDLEEDRLGCFGAGANLGHFALGLSAKYFTSRLVGTDEGSAMMGDFGGGMRIELGGPREGWMGESPDWMYVGVSVNNLGGSVDFGGPADPPPTLYRLGVSVGTAIRRNQRILFATAVDVARSTAQPEARGGVEFEWLMGFLTARLRAGCSLGRSERALSGGLGLKVRGVFIDYACLATNGPFGATHHVSAGLDFGGFRSRGPAE
jgi:hypothetical protein